MNRKKGFTLIESLISLAVLAGLMAAVTPVALTQLHIAYARHDANEVLLVQQAARNFFKDNYEWPASIQELKDGEYLNPSWHGNDSWGEPIEVESTEHMFKVTLKGIPEKYHGGATSILPMASVQGSDISSTVPPSSEALAFQTCLHKSSVDPEYRTMHDTLKVPKIQGPTGKPYYVDYETGLAYAEDVWVEAWGKYASEFKPKIHRIRRVVQYQDVYDLHPGSPAQTPGQVWGHWDYMHSVTTVYEAPGFYDGWYHAGNESWAWDGGGQQGYGDGGTWHTITHGAPGGWTFSHAIPLGSPGPRILQDSGGGASASYQANDFPGNHTLSVGLQVWGWRIQ